MSNLFIEIHQVNEDAHYRLADPVFEETKYSKIGELYQALVKEYGRCVSKLYIGAEATKEQIGWVFEKREAYSDVGIGKPIKRMNSKERAACSFVCSTWVSVHKEKPTRIVKYHFAKF